METNIKKALKFFESIQLKRDEVSGTILRKMGLRWEVVELVDLWIEAAKKADIGLGEVKAMVQSKYVAKPYNSVKEWLEKQTVNDENGFRKLARLVLLSSRLSTEFDRFEEALKKWFVCAVKAIYEEGYAPKHCLVLIGEEGIGKTHFLKSFVPSELTYLVVTDPSSDKMCQLKHHLIAFIEEVGDWLSVPVNAQKHRAYLGGGRCAKRLASFLGTAKSGLFIKDYQSDRFVCFKVERIWNRRGYDHYLHETGKRAKRPIIVENFDYANIWALALKLYQEEYPCEYSAEEVKRIKEWNKTYVRGEVQEELFLQYFEKDSDRKRLWLTGEIMQVLNRKQKHYYFTPVSLGKIIKTLGIEREAVRKGKKVRKGYFVKEIKTMEPMEDQYGKEYV